MVLITGGSGSGKSEFAENLTMDISKKENRIYIATMKVFGLEGEKKVQRHRLMRNHKGFETIECPENISLVLEKNEFRQKTILFECMSNYVANAMFSEKNTHHNVVEKITNEIVLLNKACDNLIIVSNEVFSDGNEYAEETKQFIKNLAEINKNISLYASDVIEVVYGIPVKIKG